MARRMIFCLGLLAALPLADAARAPAAAQELPAVQDTLPPVDSIPHEAPVPRNAFIRALIVPGWGHFGIGEHRRGAVYAALQTTSWLMLAKTVHGLGDARDIERGIAALGTDSLRAAMAADTALARRLDDPIAFDDALADYPGIANARGLVTARERHRQDWIVYTLVTTFAAAIDAYVTAHLADFPHEIAARPTPDGGFALSMRVPVGRSR
jgi:hypothetical protein